MVMRFGRVWHHAFGQSTDIELGASRHCSVRCPQPDHHHHRQQLKISSQNNSRNSRKVDLEEILELLTQSQRDSAKVMAQIDARLATLESSINQMATKQNCCYLIEDLY